MQVSGKEPGSIAQYKFVMYYDEHHSKMVAKQIHGNFQTPSKFDRYSKGSAQEQTYKAK